MHGVTRRMACAAAMSLTILGAACDGAVPGPGQSGFIFDPAVGSNIHFPSVGYQFCITATWVNNTPGPDARVIGASSLSGFTMATPNPSTMLSSGQSSLVCITRTGSTSGNVNIVTSAATYGPFHLIVP